MSKYFILLIFSFSFLVEVAQNIKIEGLKKIYYYKTSDDFFCNKKDSLVADDIVYDYGKISFTDKKSNKKIKFHLHKDSSIFAFKIIYIKDRNNIPIYAISPGEKSYGVYMGGNKDLFCIFYSRGNLFVANYDSQNYVVGYNGSVDEFGYNLVFTKKNFESKKNGDIEYFIKDKEQLYNKYVKERADATTFYWNKYFIIKQVDYLREYNN